MKAMVCEAFGGSEVLALREVPDPPAPGQAAPKEVALSQHASWVLSWERSSAVIAVEGALDVASAGAFASTLAALGADGCDVIVDMARVGVIETSTWRGKEQLSVAGARAGVDQKQAIARADQESTDVHEPPAALNVVGVHLELR